MNTQRNSLLGAAIANAILSWSGGSWAAAQPDLRIEQGSYNISGDRATVTVDVCNDSNGGSSGTLLYELALRDPVAQTRFTLGSDRGDSLGGGSCRRGVVRSFDVNLNVPDGDYEVVLIVGSFDGSGFVERDRLTFDNMLRVGGGGSSGPGPSPGGGGQNSCAFAFDGECDDGRPGSITSLCSFGTDSADCGGGGSGAFVPSPLPLGGSVPIGSPCGAIGMVGWLGILGLASLVSLSKHSTSA